MKRLFRTTDGGSEICSYSLSEFKKMKIDMANGSFERISL
ncbi:hypothetical protein PRIO_6269 [Paenibacillus riograndensis SBR5]|uniref:Uncharacterized protein n=1 Tax=Paenibacillus riograndensis SBR5 TaxID=1073571 RepID=A0A0E4HIA3_9BACL|nr:hypothetical protein PRIO_6269 [Paenibacillus riograndensis SBR5]